MEPDASTSEATAPEPIAPPNAPLPKSVPRHKRRRSFEANVLFFTISFLIMIGALGFLYYTIQQYTTTTLTPQESYSSGITMINDGFYGEASNHFMNFSRRYANDPLKSDAEFMSAYALQLTAAEPHSTAMQANNGALIQLESFVTSNPTHEKTARAQTLIGILNYKIGNYSKAIYSLYE